MRSNPIIGMNGRAVPFLKLTQVENTIAKKMGTFTKAGGLDLHAQQRFEPVVSRWRLYRLR